MNFKISELPNLSTTSVNRDSLLELSNLVSTGPDIYQSESVTIDQLLSALLTGVSPSFVATFDGDVNFKQTYSWPMQNSNCVMEFAGFDFKGTYGYQFRLSTGEIRLSNGAEFFPANQSGNCILGNDSGRGWKKLYMTGDINPMVIFNEPVTNNAGSSTGTLTNAPVAGDPYKWILIEDAGTQLVIPAWLKS